MTLDQIISLGSALISFVGLLFVALQLREGNKQQQLSSLVEIYDINRELITLGFSHPQLFAVLQDTKNVDPTWERRYLQLWFNHLALIHSYLLNSVFDAELGASLRLELSSFVKMENARRHWQQYQSYFPRSFQELVNESIGPLEAPVQGSGS